MLKIAKFNDAMSARVRELVGASQFNDTQTTVYIYGPFGDGKIISGKNVDTNQGMVVVSNFDEVKDMLALFGDMIYSIIVYFQDIASEQGLEVVEYINDHCSSTLKRIQLLNCSGTVLDGLQNTFSDLTHLTFTTHPTEKLQTENNKLNETFPNLTYLSTIDATDSVKVHDWEFIHGHYSNLKELLIKEPQTKLQNVDHFVQIIKFLHLNSHIDTVTIKYGTLKLWFYVNHLLSNLEDIRFQGISRNFLNSNCSSLEFLNAKKFSFQSFSIKDFPKRVSLLNVDVFQLVTPFNFTAKWMKFCSNQINKNLTTFVVDTSHLAREYFLEIPELFNQLRNVTINSRPTYFTADDILAFLERSANLNELNMEIRLTASDQKFLQETLAEQWVIRSELKRMEQIGEDVVFLEFTR